MGLLNSGAKKYFDFLLLILISVTCPLPTKYLFAAVVQSALVGLQSSMTNGLVMRLVACATSIAQVVAGQSVLRFVTVLNWGI